MVPSAAANDDIEEQQDVQVHAQRILHTHTSKHLGTCISYLSIHRPNAVNNTYHHKYIITYKYIYIEYR